MQPTLNSVSASIRNSRMLRLFWVGFLVLLLEIPINMIGRLVYERKQRQQEAIEEVSAKWGKSQAITGPALIIPYTHRWSEIGANNQPITRSETRYATFLPEKLQVVGKLDSAILNRGIYTVPVYNLDLTIEGEFQPPNFAELGIDPGNVAWERAHLSLGISDAHAIQEQTAVSWNGNRIPFLPSADGFAVSNTGIHAQVSANAATQRYGFTFPLLLKGSLNLNFVPFGQETIVDLESNSGNPSFQGNWLPTRRQVTESHFNAQWTIPFLGRNYPQAWTSQTDMREAVQNSQFGVHLVDPINPYRMSERSVKYAGLFILLTFTVVWLIELLAGVRVHPIQYLLLGAALCMFYLLELSLMEHLGFLSAYILACAAVIGLIGVYSYVVLRRFTRSMIIVIGVSGLYTYLYILLTNEDYALLIGSLGLFVILAVIMFVTRRVDWYGSETREPNLADPRV